MDLGNDLRIFRKENKWTQKQISEKLGIPLTTWSSWENNQSQPKIEILITLRRMGLEITGLTTNVSPIASQEVIDYSLKKTSENNADLLGTSEPPETESAAEPSASLAAKRRANTAAAITMLEASAKSIEALAQSVSDSITAAVRLLKENIGE